MDKKKILQHLDHTLLKQDATWEQIKTLCDEGMQYHVASGCIPPCYVKEARFFSLTYIGWGSASPRPFR